jgi:peptidoglycan/xylan/chitin deacetylase (PgdA/CDA1 family)
MHSGHRGKILMPMFFRTPFLLPWLYPDLMWRVPTEEKNIYLSFDDGPVPGPTEFVLDQLKSVDAIATFFCIGDNVKKHPAIFRQLLEQGHGIGNHTFNHLKGWNHSVEDYCSNISRCEDEFLNQGVARMKSTSNQATRLFRPPYGRIRRSQIHALKDYRIVMWDVLTHDYSRGLSQEKCLHYSIQAARPGSIVVFHDSLKAEKNMTYVLPRFMDHCANLGYSFKPIPIS